jgi:MoCo/4Fe-4S cofactor protein with predicted Tat translocation signal
MSNNKVYWRGTEELEKNPSFIKNAEKEFSRELPIDQFLGSKDLDATNTSRRDFLKFMGFGITAATLAACETPVVKSLPYVVKPDEVMPGIANYYASTYFDGVDFASVLVKTREGRPIHIEGNKHGHTTKGGVSARVNSSILSLYNKRRYTSPLKGGASADWASIDGEIKGLLENVKASGGNVRVLSSTMISPSSLALIDAMRAHLAPSAESEGVEAPSATLGHVMYDAVSASGIITANGRTHGVAAVPNYKFDKAEVLVSFGADFLVNWLNPIGFSRDYAKLRNPEGTMSKHYQFETVLTTTGSNADVRGAIKPSEHGAAVAMLANAVANSLGVAGYGGAQTLIADDNNVEGKIKDAAAKLVAARGKSLVISDANDPNIQALVNGINEMLGNYGQTLDLTHTLNLRKGSDAEVAGLIAEMNAGAVDMLFIMDSDPVYTMPAAWGFADALTKVKTSVSFAEKPDFTSVLTQYVCPTHHFLESWNDANPCGNEVTFTQPTINPINNTRQWQDSFMTWMGMDGSYYDYVKARWDRAASISDDPSVIFASPWNKMVHDGVGALPAMEVTEDLAGPTFAPDAVAAAASALTAPADGWEVSFYVKTGIGTGLNADNPWLQELPDPVTKVVWDQYVAMNPADMKSDAFQLNTMMGEQELAGMVRVTVNGTAMELPAVAVPGQKRGTVGIALGYGKGYEGTRLIGQNAFAVLPVSNGFIRYNAPATVEKIEGTYNIASTQTQHTMMGRKILNETSLGEFKGNGREHWNPVEMLSNAYGEKVAVDKLDLWAEHDIDLGHRWGLSIDLNTCIGCGSCVTACHSENNVPVVGKDEVNRTRTMSWMRIDRYFSSDADPEIHGDLNQEKDYDAMEVPSDYPEVGFMPVMCQHCNHAPCETVCPVAATTHSDEGYNQMTYNRCIGTRYCANNCPFKVRRFNWFNYVGDSKFTDVNPAQDSLSRMVLNPDVVVRSRGVMEKCSLCVQRVQAGKLEAKKAGTPVMDGSIQTACSASCPTNAITFGDINDKDSDVRAQAKNDRAYNLLEEIGVKPNIWYQTKVRNVELGAEHSA